MPPFISSLLHYARELPAESIVGVEFAMPPFISSHLHYARELPAESIVGVEFAKPSFISSDLRKEWKTFRRYITNQPKEDINEQLKELSTNSMLEIWILA